MSGMALDEEEMLLCQRYDIPFLKKPFVAEELLSALEAITLSGGSSRSAVGWHVRRGSQPKAVEGETQDQPHNRHVPTNMRGMTLHVEGLRWHDPDHACARCPVVGAPNHSECYGAVAPSRSWGRWNTRRRRVGIRNAAHCTPSTAFVRL